MPKQRERSELQWLVEMGRQFELSLDKLQPLYIAFLDHIFPEIEKSTPDEREAAYQRIFDYAVGLEPEMGVTVKEAMKIGQLKLTSRSDNYFTRENVLKKIGILEQHPKTGETFVRLLVDNSGGNGSGEGGSGESDDGSDTTKKEDAAD